MDSTGCRAAEAEARAQGERVRKARQKAERKANGHDATVHVNGAAVGSHAPQIMNADELEEQLFKEPKFVVPDYLTEGLGILAGKPKIGKSWKALQIADAVSRGAATLGIRVEQGKVLYLGLEDTPRRLQARLRAVRQGARPNPLLDLTTQWRRLDDGGLEDLRKWLAAHPTARLVVVDTFAKVRPQPKRDQGIYQGDYDALGGLKALADEFSVCILILHHQRKGAADDPLDTVSGSTGFTGAADVILVLTRNRGQVEGTLHVMGRDIEERETAVRFDKETGLWTMLGDAAEHRMSQERGDILREMKNADGPVKPQEIAKALGKNHHTVRNLMAKMESAGDVRKAGPGLYDIANRKES